MAANNGSDNGAHLLVKPRLRSLVTFNTMNLTKPVYIGRFDCIFCMDVLPHLSRVQRTALIERLHLYLEPGGYLFLSQTEKLQAPNLNFRSETFDGYTFHRKPTGRQRGLRTVTGKREPRRTQGTQSKSTFLCVLRILRGSSFLHANKNSFVLNSLIVSLSFAAFSNSNFFAASRMSLSSLPM